MFSYISCRLHAFFTILSYVVSSKVDNIGESFAMKDMRATKLIIDIRIMHQRKEKKLRMSQELCIKRVMQRSYIVHVVGTINIFLSILDNEH